MTAIVEQIATPAMNRGVVLDLPPGVPMLGSLYLYIAGSCNLACRHCWIVPNFLRQNKAAASYSNGTFLKLESLRKAIEQAKPLGLSTVKLTGGEPTLHPEFREVIRIIYENDLSVVLETNGTLVDDDLAHLLKGGKVGFISVSLDGATPETHDYLRNVPGSYHEAIRGIKALNKVGFKTQAICTLHKGNVHEMDALVTLAEDLGCGSVKFNTVQRVGRGERFGSEHGLSVPEVIELQRYLEEEIMPKHNMIILLDLPPAFMSIGQLLSSARNQCRVMNILGILGSGELALCGIGVTIPDLIYGHIETDDLRDIWCNHPGLRLLREQVPAKMEGICGRCLHRDLCRGHCVAHNYHFTQQLNAAHPFCATADEMGLFSASRKQ